ncbi:acetoin utilization protein AcuC [Pseudoroseomonas wenyumeiae]|uniref:Acetoin utilization protein AcuC n=1 Tax=Teichococcus wenyumeiae TaxID=2478470 RepID=A0A3A9JFG7_9PROT|nr:acetoin utilization protein AcuC [Pseudoroseomonas wenyumeiae]RKK06077.1 acetoin utilization protein AcuC [Pseudoroseomonas wenyumeiae]RMI25566.1 acetoin utilization protein AcuC [Pseudoroseomonas wenyumeiae]
MKPLLIASEIYRKSSYGPKHPLAIPRVSTAVDLIQALGWMDPGRTLDSPMATVQQLTRFHTPAYIAALRAAEETQEVPDEVRARHHIGAHGNPVYKEVFRRPATSAGGVLLAARLTAEGGIVHAPGGGTHHGQPDRASGFCYVNDAVLGLLAWLDQGLTNILYLDIDAHHGDGVQDAFHDDPRVFTLSIHEAKRWPFTGALDDRAGGHARNIPVPQGLNDSEMDWLLHQAILPLIHHLRPQAIMLQCGADGLEEDPLAKLSLSNNAHWAVVRAVMRLAPRLIVLGGGGYNPWSVGRCWAGIWGVLEGRSPPERLPAAAESVLRALAFNRAAGRNPPEHWFTTLRDTPRPGAVRSEIRHLAEATLEGLPQLIRGVA